MGVFLSTSAEGEVYEWSEVQSGIFSHEVRSGLSGAADADGDGTVSYDELAAFVSVANRALKNENYRPKVFARGPGGKGGAKMFRSGGAVGRRIVLGKEQRRIWIRDHRGVRLVDLHKEKGRESTIVVPVPSSESLYVQERMAATSPADRPSVRELVIPGQDKPVRLAAVLERASASLARGHDAVFNEIFAEPYGPDAFERYRRDHPDAPEPVFGISQRDARRMGHYLSHLSRAERRDRHISASLLLGLGGVIGAAGGGLYFDLPAGQKTYALIPAILGGAFALYGGYRLATLSEGETAYQTFQLGLHRPGVTRESLIAETEVHLQAMVDRERSRRTLTSNLAFVAGGLNAVSTGLMASIRVFDRQVAPASVLILYGGLSAFYIGAGVAIRFTESPYERILRLYREDPDLNLRFGLAPIPGGLTMGLSGAF